MPASLKDVNEGGKRGILTLNYNNLSYIDPRLMEKKEDGLSVLFPIYDNDFLTIDFGESVLNENQIASTFGSGGKLIEIRDKKDIYRKILQGLSKDLEDERISQAYEVFDFSDLISFARTRKDDALAPLLNAGYIDVATPLREFYQTSGAKKEIVTYSFANWY